MFLQGTIGQPSLVSAGPGSPFTLRGGQMGDLMTSQLQGRFYENNYRGNLFCDGGGTQALTLSTTGSVAATTPLLGVYNPSTSPVNLVVLQAMLVLHNTLLNSTDPGGLNWATSYANAGITAGRSPFNRKNLSNNGSQAKGLYFTAITGLTNPLVIQCGSSIGLMNTAMPGTATCSPAYAQTENLDGSFIVPPGGVLALLNTNSASPFVSVSGNLLWAEVPL